MRRPNNRYTPAWLALLVAPLTLAQAPEAPEEQENPTRGLEEEIEDFPEPEPPAANGPALTIPEQVEQHPAASPRARAPAAQIDAAEIQRVFGRDVPAIELDSLDARQVSVLQRQLRSMGHYLGRIDGVAGPQTRAALRALLDRQHALAQRLLAQGQLTSDLALALGLDLERQPVSGANSGSTPPPARQPSPQDDQNQMERRAPPQPPEAIPRWP